MLPTGERVQPLSGAFVIAVHSRVERLAGRLARLLERALDGTLPKPRARPSALGPKPDGNLSAENASAPVVDAVGSVTAVRPPASEMCPDAPPRIGARDLPRGFGWLIALRVPDAAAHAARLRYLLQDPEMVALASSHPSFGRVLRPLCHMLAIRPHPDLVLLPPPPPSPRRPRVPRVPRARAARMPTSQWARPLPHCDWMPGQTGSRGLGASSRHRFKPA